MMRFKSIAVVVAALAVVAVKPACAEDNYPARPIRLIVGFAAGSSGDVMARIVGHKLGDVLKKKFGGWNAYLFTADLRLSKLIRLSASRRTPLFNGAIECRLFEYKIVAGSNRP